MILNQIIEIVGSRSPRTRHWPFIVREDQVIELSLEMTVATEPLCDKGRWQLIGLDMWREYIVAGQASVLGAQIWVDWQQVRDG